jgi:hypothetical protein
MNYGERIQYFVGPDADSSLDLFIAFAESKGYRLGESAAGS